MPQLARGGDDKGKDDKATKEVQAKLAEIGKQIDAVEKVVDQMNKLREQAAKKPEDAGDAVKKMADLMKTFQKVGGDLDKAQKAIASSIKT